MLTVFSTYLSRPSHIYPLSITLIRPFTATSQKESNNRSKWSKGKSENSNQTKQFKNQGYEQFKKNKEENEKNFDRKKKEDAKPSNTENFKKKFETTKSSGKDYAKKEQETIKSAEYKEKKYFKKQDDDYVTPKTEKKSQDKFRNSSYPKEFKEKRSNTKNYDNSTKKFEQKRSNSPNFKKKDKSAQNKKQSEEPNVENKKRFVDEFYGWRDQFLNQQKENLKQSQLKSKSQEELPYDYDYDDYDDIDDVDESRSNVKKLDKGDQINEDKSQEGRSKHIRKNTQSTTNTTNLQNQKSEKSTQNQDSTKKTIKYFDSFSTINLNNPMLQKFRRFLKDSNKLLIEKKFIIENLTVLNELLVNGFPPDILAFSDKALLSPHGEKLQENFKKVPQRALLHVAHKSIQSLRDTVETQGVIAIFPRPKNGKIVNKTSRMIICDNISDPGNLGTLLRSAVSFGADTFAVMNGCCDIWSSKVIRAGCGAHFHIKIVQLNSWEQTLETLKNFDFRVVAAAGTSESNLSDIRLRQVDKIALIIGGESEDLPSIIKQQINSNQIQAVKIPLKSIASSLNPAVTGSIIMSRIF